MTEREIEKLFMKDIIDFTYKMDSTDRVNNHRVNAHWAKVDSDIYNEYPNNPVDMENGLKMIPKVIVAIQTVDYDETTQTVTDFKTYKFSDVLATLHYIGPYWKVDLDRGPYTGRLVEDLHDIFIVHEEKQKKYEEEKAKGNSCTRPYIRIVIYNNNLLSKERINFKAEVNDPISWYLECIEPATWMLFAFEQRPLNTTRYDRLAFFFEESHVHFKEVDPKEKAEIEEFIKSEKTSISHKEEVE